MQARAAVLQPGPGLTLPTCLMLPPIRATHLTQDTTSSQGKNRNTQVKPGTEHTNLRRAADWNTAATGHLLGSVVLEAAGKRTPSRMKHPACQGPRGDTADTRAAPGATCIATATQLSPMGPHTASRHDHTTRQTALMCHAVAAGSPNWLHSTRPLWMAQVTSPLHHSSACRRPC